MTRATAFAHINIALVKYWGKADAARNLPAVGSLSLTLDQFGTTTTVAVANGKSDSFLLNGVAQGGESLERVKTFFWSLRAKGENPWRVESENSVPTAAGLASSASGFAALALAGAKAYGLDLSQRELSALARLGSGSAARSIYGGFVHMDKEGEATRLEAPKNFDVRMIVLQCASGSKAISSRDAMVLTAGTSPYYQAWLDTHAADLQAATVAVKNGDLEQLGQIMEHSTFKMHATMWASQPAICYWNGVTFDALHLVRELRAKGHYCFATMDAGPHVKVLCSAAESKRLAAQLSQIPGIIATHVCGPGNDARLI